MILLIKLNTPWLMTSSSTWSQITGHFIATGMAPVNCSVVNHTSNKTVFPWSIMSARESGVTVQQFYNEHLLCKLKEPPEMELQSAFLGKSKDSLDKIELSLPLDSAIPLFGSFLCYDTCDRLLQMPPA